MDGPARTRAPEPHAPGRRKGGGTCQNAFCEATSKSASEVCVSRADDRDVSPMLIKQQHALARFAAADFADRNTGFCRSPADPRALLWRRSKGDLIIVT